MRIIEKILRKLLICAVSFCLVFTMMPVNVFGSAKVDGDKDEDGNYTHIRSIQIDDEPYIYQDVSDILQSNDLNRSTLRPLAAYLLEDWAHIAGGIYEQKSVAPGHSLVGSTWLWPDPQYAEYWNHIFFHEDPDDPLKIELRQWLGDPNPREKGFWGVLNPRTGTYSTGLCAVTSLSKARDRIISEVAKGFDHLSEDDIKNYRGPDAILSNLKNSKETNCFFNIVVSHDETGGTYQTLNAYGVAIYDFDLVTILDDDLEYPNPKVENKDGMDDDTIVSYSENKASKESTVSMELSTGVTQSLSNEISKSSNYEFDEGIGSSTAFGLKFLGSGAQETVAVKVSAKEAFGSAFTESGTVTKTIENKVGASVNLPPHTAVEIKQTDGHGTDVITYDCPVAIRYKVAVFSLSRNGTDVFSTSDSHGCDFCTIFGYGTETGGISAPENLYIRAKTGEDMEDYGKVEGYVYKDLVDNAVDFKYPYFWNNQKLDDRSTYIPLSTLADSSMTVDTIKKSNEVGDIVPLYKLADIKLAEWEKKSYDMMEGDEIRIESPDAIGFNDKGVEYYGFDTDAGHWILADRNGEPIDSSDIIDCERSEVTNRLTLKAKKAGTAYLKYVIDDGVVYETKDGYKVSNDLHAPVSSLIEISVSPSAPVNSLDGYRIETRTTSAKATVAEEVDLIGTFDAAVIDRDDRAVASATDYELRDTRDGNVTITDTGMFKARKEGDYKVRAVYERDGDRITSEWLTLKVKNTQPMTVKAKAKTAKYRKVRKKAVTVSPITVGNAQGKVTYKKLSGSSKLKVNKDTGKVTVKKKTKKGTYKIKVEVNAAGNDRYDPAAKTITVKVRVK